MLSAKLAVTKHRLCWNLGERGARTGTLEEGSGVPGEILRLARVAGTPDARQAGAEANKEGGACTWGA